MSVMSDLTGKWITVRVKGLFPSILSLCVLYGIIGQKKNLPFRLIKSSLGLLHSSSQLSDFISIDTETTFFHLNLNPKGVAPQLHFLKAPGIKKKMLFFILIIIF